MSHLKGKIHKRGPEQGYDTTMCNRWAAPVYYSKGISDRWRDVTCKSCLRTRGGENEAK